MTFEGDAANKDGEAGSTDDGTQLVQVRPGWEGTCGGGWMG